MKIRFSHKGYCKLWGQTSGELLAVKLLDSKELHEDLIEYDTKYDVGLDSATGEWVVDYYPLPKGKLVQLVFLGNKGIPFCTIRSQKGYAKGYTPLDKYSYYSSHIGETFDVIITKE